MQMTTTPLPDAVQWSEGMLLSPQHLQQNDIYWHAQLQHRLACSNPHFWGVRHMQVQLIKECILVNQLECVLPDGTVVCHPSNFARQPEPLLQIDVAACKTGEAAIRIWLVVPERASNAARQSDQDRRYNSHIGQLTADENTGLAEIKVGRLQLRYDLVMSKLPPSASACPLLEVERDAQGVLRISQYHPPMSCLSASQFLTTHGLLQLMQAKYEAWWAKAEELMRESTGFSPDGKLNTEGLRNHQVARHLACGLPALAVALDAGGHPQALYQALAQMVGQMVLFARQPLPLKMQPYQHDNCLPQFQAAWRYIDETLATELERVQQDRLNVPKPLYDTQPFQAHGELGFGRQLPAHLDGDLIIEVKPHQGQSLEQIGRWLNQADIASASLITQLRRQRVPGAQVRQLKPDEILRRQLPPLADLFLVQNRKVELNDCEPQDLFAANQSLFIQGKSSANMPAAIFLYRKLSTDHAKL